MLASDRRRSRGRMWAGIYSDVENRTKGEESLQAAAVEASRLAVAISKRILLVYAYVGMYVCVCMC